jgi:hypothetical protein
VFDVIQLEGDAGGGLGAIDSVFPVGMTDGGGFWTTTFRTNELENGTMTLLLVQGLAASSGTDLDTDDDGILDLTPWVRVIDAVAVTDGGGSDHVYTSVVLGPGFDGNSLTPGGASRIPNGTDTDSVADWMRNDFDGEGLLPAVVGTAEPGEALNTPEAVNNAVPVCSVALPSVETLWSPNHKFVPIDIVGVTDADGDPLTITIESIYQDEPVDAPGSGNTSPDGQGVGTANAEVRAERAGGGNGRVYHIAFTASDGRGGNCSGVVQVSVPKSKKDTPVDDGPLFDSTESASALVLSGLSSTSASATESSRANRASADANGRPGSNLGVTLGPSLTASDSGRSYSPRDQVFAALPASEHDLEDFWTHILDD